MADEHKVREAYRRLLRDYEVAKTVGAARAILEKTQASIASKLSRNTAPAAFFVAALVAIGAEVVKLEDI
jgi:hypothetical protein